MKKWFQKIANRFISNPVTASVRPTEATVTPETHNDIKYKDHFSTELPNWNKGLSVTLSNQGYFKEK